MAEKRRFLDIWIVESNTVYKEVPYEVVTDWVQQGRVLEGDMYKPSGTAEWFRFGGSSEFMPYFPQPEPHRVEDTAEALEPVETEMHAAAAAVGAGGHRHREEEDDDVDMIPLIDVSLVLLVFFMLTASAGGLKSFVDKPQVDHTLLADNPESLRIDISRDTDQNGNPTDTPLYSIGEGENPPDADEKDLRELGAMLARLEARLQRTNGTIDVVINADKGLKSGHTRNVLLALRADRFRDKIKGTYFGAKQRTQ